MEQGARPHSQVSRCVQAQARLLASIALDCLLQTTRTRRVRHRRGIAVTAAIYLRVSTEEQRERQSIATQRDFAQRFCELHGIPVVGLYADDGVSGVVPINERR